MSKTENFVKVAIIGAGVGGITAGISLQNKLKFYDYTIYELASDVGGTWRQNTYPGCACDIPAHWYSLSSDPNPDWSRSFASFDEIQAYWKHLSVKHKVEDHIEYHSELVSAVWNEEDQHYVLTIKDTQTQAIRTVIAQVVISATGIFRVPRWPDIPGRESFKGSLLHAQMWDHSVGLRGKRVAVIGNGCSGSQIVSAISEDPTVQVMNFCRTPSWYLTRPQMEIPSWLKWSFRNVPLALRLVRYFVAGFSEYAYHNLKLSPASSFLRSHLQASAVAYIKNTAPTKHHENLIPKYPLGCKRVIIDPGYLAALNRPNVDLDWNGVSEIVPDGIVTKSGEKHEFDVICFATGFEIESSYTLDVKGIGGKSLQEYYDQEGGPTGYMGTTIPGFPNWVTILGPNTATGHASVIFCEEVQSNYAAQLIKPILEAKYKSFVPRVQPTQAWNEWAQLELRSHVWSTCLSWYRAGSGGKIIALWPGSTTHLWWSLRKPIWKDYEIYGAKEISAQNLYSVGLGAAAVLGTLGAAAIAFTAFSE